MHIDWAKLTLAAKNYSPGCHCLRWSLPQQAPLAFLSPTNAHRVGKNDRMPPKVFRQDALRVVARPERAQTRPHIY
jgi:hypothetical protein